MSVTYQKVRESARRVLRDGLNPAEHAPPAGKLREVFMQELEKPKRNWLEDPPICPGCEAPGVLVTGADLYPRRPDLRIKKFWRCDDCDAHVGTHFKSEFAAPLGLIATAQHRRLKMAAHQAFDALWKGGTMKRAEAYDWLQAQMDSDRTVHIGWSQPATLLKIIEICNKELARE